MRSADSACVLYDDRATGPFCRAVAGDHAPSLHERELFCTSEECSACPTLDRRLIAGRALSETEYVALWMAPMPLSEPAHESADD